ncbi:MAG: ATP-binding cassette domain-containing protein [Acidimicrobiia bacterium]
MPETPEPPAPSSTPAENVIECRSLSKVFPSRSGAPTVTAVDALQLTVRRGEIFGLLGPNGAGKTTTVGMLTTRTRPTEGTAAIAGIDVGKQPSVVKQLIGVVPQMNTLDRSLSVAENLYFHGRYFGMTTADARNRTNALLEQFRLSDRANADTITLSGGMAQRLMLARAVMHRPQVLFLDEPTAGLDPQSRIALWEVVRELHDAGQTILLTTHYMEEADQLCERLAIMDHGRILACDTPDALKRSVGAETEFILHATGDLSALARGLSDEPNVTRAHALDDTVRVFLAGGIHGALPRLINRANDMGYTITDVATIEPTLESVFIDLTGRDLRE